MDIQIKYGNDIVSCHISDRLRTRILEPSHNAPVPSLRQALLASLRNPIGTEPLAAMLSPEKKITIVVPDKTRQCILDRIMPVLYEYLSGHGVPAEHITILFANGTHQKQSEEETAALLGSFIWKTLCVKQHDAHDTASLEYLTTTSRGTKITLNKFVTQSDLVITVGGIMHHYFAGFGGGPKLLIPGVAGYETAKQNHRYTIDDTGSFHPDCRDGNLDTNPVYLDIIEAIGHIPNVFSVNVVLDPSNKPAGFFSGDSIAAHRRGTELASSLYEVSIREKADVIIVSPGGSPRDSTFIQSHKAIHHAYHAVKPGGMIITAAACDDGIGSPTFLNWFSIPYNRLGKELQTSYSLNGHTALSLRNKINSAGISLLSKLDSSTVSHMGITPVASMQSALDKVFGHTNGTALVYILPYGSSTVPVLHN